MATKNRTTSPNPIARTRQVAPVLRLVPNSNRGQKDRAEVQRCGVDFMHEAFDDETLGVFYGVIRRGGCYAVSIAGEARRNPTVARGVLAKLDDVLSDLV